MKGKGRIPIVPDEAGNTAIEVTQYRHRNPGRDGCCGRRGGGQHSERGTSPRQSGLKNLLDVAVLKHVELEGGLKVQERFQKIPEMPFDFERRRMSVVLGRDDGVDILVCKGAIEEVFAACMPRAIDGETGPLDASHFASAKETTAELRRGRVSGRRGRLKRRCRRRRRRIPFADEADLTLLGYIAFLTRRRRLALGAIATLKASGVQVKILTGDNDIVTRKILHEVGGLPVDRIVLSSEMTTLSPDELASLAETAAVFAKVSPSQKATIIDALHRKGHVVGFRAMASTTDRH